MDTHHLQVARTARYHVWGTPADASEWWIVLHGYGQRAKSFLEAFAPIATPQRALIAPEALSRFYTDALTEHNRVGASWMTKADRTHEIADYIGYLDALVAHIGPPPALHVLGFSQGAATASRWAVHGAPPVDRLMLWGGTVAHDLDVDAHRAALAGMRLTLIAGREDPYVTPSRWQEAGDRLRAAGVPFTTHRFDGGHALNGATLRRLARTIA
ncbi:alpha/beta hydrolase [Salisaeta longa]|uniref:alpha/beta hydrolase n=1 Tax=Salisaeta longa TaxID=503170 RepID=UPI0003B39BB9|nr:esterase [Salisaeta longa]